VTITVLERPEPLNIEANSPLCEGDDLIITADGTALEYYWSTPSGDVLVNDSPQLNIQNVQSTDAGVYTLSILDGACTSLPSDILVVEIDVVPTEQAFAGEDVFACDGMSIEVSAGNDLDLSGYWSTNEEDITVVSPQSFTSSILGTEMGETYEIVWNLSNEGCGIYSSDVMYVIAPRIPEAVVDEYYVDQGEQADFFVLENDVYNNLQVEVNVVLYPLHGFAESGFNEYIDFKADDDYWGDDELIYELCLVECPSMCDTALVIIHIKPYLEIPDVITANGDGVNDQFVITGLENFPLNELWIYNRWGHVVYKAKNYENDWDGQYNNGPLPEGTYFYVFIETGTSEPVAQGYITLHR
jgi:gliding motility-associated-like protein